MRGVSCFKIIANVKDTFLFCFVEFHRFYTIQGSFKVERSDQVSGVGYETQLVNCEDIRLS